MDEPLADPLDRHRPLRWGAAAVALVLVAALALPVAAWVVEGISATAENWILPFQAAIVLGFAAALGVMGARPEHRRRRLVVALGAGVVVLLVVDGLWWVALTG
jgi:hypothetical protein